MSRTRQATPLSLGASWAASVVFHAAMMGGLGWLVAAHALKSAPPTIAEPIPEPSPAGDGLVDIDLPAAFAGTVLENAELDPAGIPPTPSGGQTTPMLDTRTAGKGGGPTVEKAIHLADRDESVVLSPDLVSRIDRDQLQRIKSSSDRASWEDRRATTKPMELTFLAFGTGKIEERRAKAARDPSRGATRANLASVLGGAPGGAVPNEGDDAAGRQGAARSGSSRQSPGPGVHDAREGADHRSSANAMTAKPDVQQAAVSIPATEKAKPKDDTDTNQEVALRVAALVQASTQGGSPGFGIGGTQGGSVAGAGGKGGAGSHPSPLGTGIGEWFDLDSKDPRMLPYFRKIKAKVDPLWSFPKSAMLEMKQGVVILEVDIAEDGAAIVSWPPLRPSGIDEFDRNCANAIRKAQPFEPIPSSLGVKKLHIRAPFSSTSGASWAP